VEWYVLKGCGLDRVALCADEELGRLKGSVLSVQVVGQNVFLAPPPPYRRQTVRCLKLVPIVGVCRRLSETCQVDAGQLKFLFRGREIDPAEELLDVETSKNDAIRIAILRLFVSRLANTNIELELPDEMLVARVITKLPAIVRRNIERLDFDGVRLPPSARLAEVADQASQRLTIVVWLPCAFRVATPGIFI
jgi:hypothetical protein